jgi:hypothetical protein
VILAVGALRRVAGGTPGRSSARLQNSEFGSSPHKTNDTRVDVVVIERASDRSLNRIVSAFALAPANNMKNKKPGYYREHMQIL